VAAQHRPDAGQEFLDAERFGDVVIGAGVEGVDLLPAVQAAGQDDDRYRGPGAQLADDLDAVEVGQAEVEHDQVGVLAGGGVQGLHAVAGGDDLVLAGVQVDPQRPQDLRFVVDDEQPGHRPTPFPPWSRGSAGAPVVEEAAGHQGTDTEQSRCVMTPTSHPRDTHPPHQTDHKRQNARVTAGQPPYDVARPKEFDP
jgi:hypothetical protein